MVGKSSKQFRLLVAEEAARLISEQGFTDFHGAKQKAASRHGITTTRDLPSNFEIEQALIARQNLFDGDQRNVILRGLRESALEMMELLAEFDPLLAGSVLSGTAGPHSSIELHVFSDDLEAVAIHLINKDLTYHSIEKAIEDWILPGFELFWRGAVVEILVFDRGLRIAPPSPVDGKPMSRASKKKLVRLLANP